MSKTNRARIRLKEWRENPAKFFYENFKLEPEPWQIDALAPLGGAYNPRRRLGMKAATGVGKSTMLACTGWHRLACFGEKGEHPKGIAISGEGKDNLRDNLWAELSKWQQRSEFLMHSFNWTKESITAKDHAETWFLSARSYAKDADTEAIGRSLSGLHSKFPFVLLDEIGDMPVTVGQKATQIFTGGQKDALIAAAGNPTSQAGLLYHVCTTERGVWFIVTITSDPDDPKRSSRVDIEHAKEQIRLYGRDNPWIKATILGEFPEASFNALLGVEEVERAMAKHYREDVFSHTQKRIGCDVARFGNDRTVLFPRQGLVAFRPVIMRNQRTNDIAARLIAAKHRFKSELEFVDDTGGWGAGVIDSMLQGGHSPIPINFSGKALDPRFFNRRSEIWWNMAEWIKRGGALPKIGELVRELTSPTYTYQEGKIRLEEKAMIKERLGYSPDLADALALTFALPDQPSGFVEIPGLGTVRRELPEEKVVTDWDPFGDDRI